MDTDGNGMLTKGEFGKIMERMGHKMTSFMGGHRHLDKVFASIDLDGDGRIPFDEFLKYFKRQHPETQDDVDALLRWEFENADADNSGELDKTEIGTVMKNLGLKTRSVFGSSRKLDEAFAEMKGSGVEGRVRFEEFRTWYQALKPLKQSGSTGKIETKSTNAKSKEILPPAPDIIPNDHPNHHHRHKHKHSHHHYHGDDKYSPHHKHEHNDDQKANGKPNRRGSFLPNEAWH
jgi:Ca2+-binding EF-hand superfamily protein